MFQECFNEVLFDKFFLHGSHHSYPSKRRDFFGQDQLSPSPILSQLFKDGVAGKILKLSPLYIVNKIKEENYAPDFVRLADFSNTKEKDPIRNKLLREEYLL